MTPSWVVWFKDGRYAYSWGETADIARENYLREWAAGIARVAPAGEHVNALPPHMLIRQVTRPTGKQMPDEWLEEG